MIDLLIEIKKAVEEKKAIVAIAHRILLGIYHVIKDGVEFRDLGEDYLTLRNKSQRSFICGSRRLCWDFIWFRKRHDPKQTRRMR